MYVPSGMASSVNFFTVELHLVGCLIFLSHVAASYLFGQLSFDILFSLLVLYTSLVLDSS